MSAYDQWTRLNRWEKAYIASHPHHAPIIRESKNTAFTETTRRFGYNGHNDESDAFRHCFWSATLARDLGYGNAYFFTTAHESGDANPPDEKEMDLHNNGVGLGIGAQYVYVAPGLGRVVTSDAELSERCFRALNNGELRVLAPAGTP